MADKPKKYVTPKGEAFYPWLNKADTKFKAEGEYRVKLAIPDADAQTLIDEVLEPAYEASLKAARSNPKKKNKKVKEGDRPWTAELDDDGNETGRTLFNFKRLASGVSKKTGEPWSIKPDLFDAKGHTLASDVQIWGGSILKVAFTIGQYDTPAAGASINLRIEGVQVIKLVEGGGRSAATYGFGNEAEEDDDDDEDAATEDSEEAVEEEADEF